MSPEPYRAVAVLTPRPGQEQALEQFTLGSLATIRTAAGLRKVEVSRAVGGPAHLVLYYWWESPAASAAYMGGPVYAEIGPKLASFVQDHVLVASELLEP